MYLLSIVIGVASFIVSRGPDGKPFLFLGTFAMITVVYIWLAWVTRRQAMWTHIGLQFALFVGAAGLGMTPKPHLEEMAGMLYMMLPAAIAGMIVLAILARLLARWV